MRTSVSAMFSIDAPIFAFSHCRDVVAAASKAGGFGVLGASITSVEQLEAELDWIDRNCDGRPYGVDVIFPNKFVDIDTEPGAVERQLPPQHRAFVEDLLKQHGVAALPAAEAQAARRRYLEEMTMTPREAERRLDVVFRHPQVRFIVSALGPLPRPIVERAHAAGMRVGGLVGKAEHARKHLAAGTDIIIATGWEAGGHTGDISTMVLVPEIVDAVAPAPVLAAGGIGCGRQIAASLALGAEGVWCGTLWLATAESEVSPELREKILAASSSDTTKTLCNSGKPARRLVSGWTKAWDAADAPKPLPMPLQGILTQEPLERIARSRAQALLTYPAGQIVGRLNETRTVRQVFYDLLEDYADAVERLERISAVR